MDPVISAGPASTSPSSLATFVGPAAAARVTALEREVTELKSQLLRAKELNTSLYESALTAILGEKSSSSVSPDHATQDISAVNAKSGAAADGRAAKRGRFE